MKIKEICDYGKKSKIKAGEGLSEGNVKFFTSSSESNKYVNEEQFTSPGIIMGTGGNATLHYCDEPFSVSTDCIVLFPKTKVSPKYLYYFFKGNFHVLQSGFKGAGLKHTSKKYIDEISLNHIPNNDEQVKIVNILDNVNEIIFKKNQQLSEYDQLIKSRFVEMFNLENLPKSRLIDIIIKGSGLSYGIIVPGENLANGIPMIRPSDFKNGYLLLDNVYKVEASIEEKYAKTRLTGEEILIQVIGQPGQVMLTDNRCINMNVTRNLAVIRYDSKIVNKYYLKEYLLLNEVQTVMIGNTNESTLKQLPLGKLKNLEVSIAPIEKQNEYGLFVEKVDKLTLTVQEQINQLQNLFDSLMQKYFS